LEKAVSQEAAFFCPHFLLRRFHYEIPAYASTAAVIFPGGDLAVGTSNGATHAGIDFVA